MTKYQQHVFENQFKKSLYTISQIVARTRSDLGVSRLGEYCATIYNNNYPYEAECTKKLHENIKVVAKTYSSWMNDVPYTTYRSQEILKTYNNKTNFSCNSDKTCAAIFLTNQLADGSFLGFNVNAGLLQFSLDLNGKKKPNRLGYDVFIFSLNKKNDTISGFLNRTPENNIADEDINGILNGNICSLTSANERNGLGCAYYALRNKCPYDDTKTYWECLK